MNLIHTVYKRHIGKLIEAHPEVFNKEKPLPLAIGIHFEIAKQHRLHPGTVTAVLSCWTNRLEYRAMLANGGDRYGLDGAKWGGITKHQQERAAKSVAKTMKRRKRNLRKQCTKNTIPSS